MHDIHSGLPVTHDGRRLAFDGAPVWMVNLPAMLRCAVFLLLGIVVIFTTARYPRLPGVAVWVCILLLVWPVMRLAWRVAETACTRLVIDDERLTWRKGILSRRVTSLELYRIQNVEARMAWWERLAGFGTLIIESSDAAYPVWVLPGIAQAEDLREALIRYASAVRMAKGIREVNMGRV